MSGPDPNCANCKGKGKLRYSTPADLAPTPIGDGMTIQGMGGSGTRACPCVRDQPAIRGKARWWESESIYGEVVDVPIGSECIEVDADCEVPRDEEGRRVHRTAENAYYPPLVSVEFPAPSVTLHADSARELAAALSAAADACDRADELAEATA